MSAPLDRLDPRTRVAAAGVWAAVVVVLRTPSAVAAALVVAALLVPLAGQGGRAAGRHLLAAAGFLALVGVTVPLGVPGPPLFTVGPVGVSAAGLGLAGAVVGRAAAVLLAALALVAPLPVTEVAGALHAFRVPGRLVALLVLTARYVPVLEREAGRLRGALRARAFRPRLDAHTWTTLGRFTGMLLVRGLERGERVGNAMKCRGFDGTLPPAGDTRPGAADAAFAAAGAAAVAALAVLEAA